MARTFEVGFLVQPLGGGLFGQYADRFGHGIEKPKLR
jgi:hypothetical protein